MKHTFTILLFGVLILLQLTSCQSSPSAAGRAADYARLDSLIGAQHSIVERYEQGIDSIKRELAAASDATARYRQLYALSEAYASYQNDSARAYINQALAEATQLGNAEYLSQCRLQHVHILSGAGLLETAQREIELINPSQLAAAQQGKYYRLLIEYYIYQAEYNQHTEYEREYVDHLISLRMEALKNIPPADGAYLMTEAEVLSDQNKHEQAIAMLRGQLGHYHSGQRIYSILTSTIAFIYSQIGKRDEQKHYLILSAESDLEGAIRENTSLRVLSSLLFDEGDFDRAYRYLSCCISDASIYGARLRNSQASSLMPKVLAAYQDSQQRSHDNVLLLLGIISFVALALAAALSCLYFVFRRLRRTSSILASTNDTLAQTNEALERTNDALAQTNEQLHERELVKEEYISRYLALSSQFIEQTDDRRKFLLRTAREKKASDLIAELKSTATSETQAKLFYENFDEAFLNIFPDFCEHVNALLQPDGQITLPAPLTSNDRTRASLTTELRILALMRLGITSNQLIASILRSGLSTIYTYRSRLKNRAIDHDHFEEQVKQILR